RSLGLEADEQWRLVGSGKSAENELWIQAYAKALRRRIASNVPADGLRSLLRTWLRLRHNPLAAPVRAETDRAFVERVRALRRSDREAFDRDAKLPAELRQDWARLQASCKPEGIGSKLGKLFGLK